MATEKAVTKCPACGGTKVTTIRFQGESYYQCMSPKRRVEDKGDEVTGTCKFWSTKWRPTT